MAIQWGSWVNNIAQLGVEFVRTSQSSTSEVWRMDVYLGIRGSINDNYNTLKVTGSFSYSGSIPVNSGPVSALKLYSASSTFTRDFGQNTTGRVSVSMTDFAVGSPTVTATFTIAARPYSAPNAPGSASARRSTDRAAVVSWETPSAGTGNPFTAFYIERSVNGGSYVRATHIASTTARSWTDTGTSSGNYYRYRVRAENGSLTSDWAYSGYVYMTPNAPANVVATKDGADIVLSWVNRGNGTYTTTIFEGNTVVKAGIGSGTTSFRVVAPSTTVPHTYTVAHVAGGLTSSTTAANTVQIAVPPNAPTGLAPNGEPQPAGDTARLSWTHNPGDNSDQTGYMLGWRRSTSAGYTWVERRGTSAGVYDLPASAATAGTVYWTVATWGEHATLGAYAPEASFDVVARPTVTVTAPSTVETDTATVTISTPVTGPVAWEAEATINGEIVTSGGYGTAPFTWELTDLPNSAAVNVRARVMTRVWSRWTAPQSFRVLYAAPSSPTVTTEWDKADYALNLTVDNGENIELTYRWTGARHGSASEKLVDGVVVATNYVPNPSFEAPDGWKYISGASLERTQGLIRQMWATGYGGHGGETGRDGAFIGQVTGNTPGRYYFYIGVNTMVNPPAGWYVAARASLAQDSALDSRLVIEARNSTGGLISTVANSGNKPAPFYRGRLETVVGQIPEGTVNLPVLAFWQTRDGTEAVGLRGWVERVMVAVAPTEAEAVTQLEHYFDGDSPATVRAVSNKVQYQGADGTWVTLADGLGVDPVVTDPTPALNRSTAYRVGAVASTGVVAWSDTIIADPDKLDEVTVFNFGDGYGQCAIIRYNPTLSENSGWAFEQSYVFAGQTVPTTIRGRARTLSQSFTGMVMPEQTFTFADVEAWRELAGWEGLVWCRRPDAEPVLGVASGVALSPEIWGGYQISLTHTESR